MVELINVGSPDWWKVSIYTGSSVPRIYYYSYDVHCSCMWFPQGNTCRGKTGYFPASYVQMISPGNQVFQALYDLTPEAPGDLQLTEGQVSVRERERERGRECVCV